MGRLSARWVPGSADGARLLVKEAQAPEILCGRRVWNMGSTESSRVQDLRVILGSGFSVDPKFSKVSLLLGFWRVVPRNRV